METAPQGPCSPTALTLRQSSPASPHLCRTSGTWHLHPPRPDPYTHVSRSPQPHVPRSQGRFTGLLTKLICKNHLRRTQSGVPEASSERWGSAGVGNSLPLAAGGLQSPCFIQSQTVPGILDLDQRFPPYLSGLEPERPQINVQAGHSHSSLWWPPSHPPGNMLLSSLSQFVSITISITGNISFRLRCSVHKLWITNSICLGFSKKPKELHKHEA